MDETIKIIIIILLILILFFFITRWYWCWYFKINHRLHELERTNELLQNIYDAVVQGTAVGAISATELVNSGKNGSGKASAEVIHEADIPDL